MVDIEPLSPLIRTFGLSECRIKCSPHCEDLGKTWDKFRINKAISEWSRIGWWYHKFTEQHSEFRLHNFLFTVNGSHVFYLTGLYVAVSWSHGTSIWKPGQCGICEPSFTLPLMNQNTNICHVLLFPLGCCWGRWGGWGWRCLRCWPATGRRSVTFFGRLSWA